MVKLLILADDFTGALDTGVQFSKKGIKTQVIVNKHWMEPNLECEVLVIDAETRHVSSKEAYETIYEICKDAVSYGVTYIYKKTDSALRGNVGSELMAMQKAVKETVYFIPAFPKMNRVTKEGILYIDGLPVKESVFGQDPFEPVLHSRVEDILQDTGYQGVITTIRRSEREQMNQEADFLLLDAETQEDMTQIAHMLKKRNKMPLLSGCAGFATELADLLQLTSSGKKVHELKKNLIFICGSVNPITKSQIAYGVKAGIPRISLTSVEKLERDFWNTEAGKVKLNKILTTQSKNLIIDSNELMDTNDTMEYAKSKGYSMEEVRLRISQTLGYLLKELIDHGMDGTFLITGGDTLLGFMQAVGSNELEPIEEIRPGCVLTSLDYKDRKYYVITKSGGFGQERLIEQLTFDLEKR